ncbi:MAG: VWA domain-containing protein [Parachlamydiaceae bacterium]
MFHFYFPWYAILLPLPFLIRRFIPSSKKNKGTENIPELHFPSFNRLKSAFSSSPSFEKRSNIPFVILFSLSWLFLVLALMQPEKVDQFSHTKHKGYDLMLAVDTSASMQAVDFSTHSKIISRLDATKDVVGKFVLGRQGDRVGLITFGEHAYLHVPLTLDTLSVSRMLNDIVSGMAGNATAIGDAIGLSVRTLRERPEGSRILVLLTDGEDNASSIPPLEAAKLAKQYGIRVYTIGVGKNGLAPFPMAGGGYGMVKISIDERLLQEIAAMTGGQYFPATDKNALESIYAKIDALEKTESNETIFLIREPLYYYPLGFAMIFLLLLSLYQITSKRGFNGS